MPQSDIWYSISGSPIFTKTFNASRLNKKRAKAGRSISFSQFCYCFLPIVAVLGNWTLPAAAQVGSNSQLTVEIDGLRNQRGQVCLSLFSSDKGFPSDGDYAAQKQCVAISTMPLFITFKNLQPGHYAVAVLHDANNDNKANRNFLGIPSEGFGFSENPSIFTGPPRFRDAAILVVGPNTSIQIQLKYLL